MTDFSLCESQMEIQSFVMLWWRWWWWWEVGYSSIYTKEVEMNSETWALKFKSHNFKKTMQINSFLWVAVTFPNKHTISSYIHKHISNLKFQFPCGILTSHHQTIYTNIKHNQSIIIVKGFAVSIFKTTLFFSFSALENYVRFKFCHNTKTNIHYTNINSRRRLENVEYSWHTSDE